MSKIHLRCRTELGAFLLYLTLAGLMPQPLRAEEICQVLDPAASSAEVEITVGDLTVRAALTRFAGVLMLRFDEIPRSRVKVVLDPSSLEFAANPKLAMVLQPLLSGPAGERLTFTSEEITARGGSAYEVAGTAEQGGRKARVRVAVTVLELSRQRTRFRGLSRQAPAEAGRTPLTGIGGTAHYDLVFKQQAKKNGTTCSP